MKKRIIVNLVLAFILVPLIKLIWDYIRIEINKDYSAFSGSFLEYEKMIASSVFLVVPIFFIIFTLLPYNIIVLYKKVTSFFMKVLLFELILIIDFCLLGTFMNIWSYPYWKNIYYLAYFIPYSFLFAGLIHWLVDKRTVDR
ncbi:hypothetical protein AQF98_05460 [Pedobacter sp. Hv1]|nr:hypothetical protein AQF98_05460 [Pedobacter sp. Hv1]